jgi:hypothetical protein
VTHVLTSYSHTLLEALRLPQIVQPSNDTPSRRLGVIDAQVILHKALIGPCCQTEVAGIVQQDGSPGVAPQGLDIATGRIEQHPRIHEGVQSCVELVALEQGLCSKLLTLGSASKVVVGSIRLEGLIGLAQRLLDVTAAK